MKTVKVTIERNANKILVSNSNGVTWEFLKKDFHGNDHSCNGAIADIAGAMLTATIVSHLENSLSPKIEYSISLESK